MFIIIGFILTILVSVVNGVRLVVSKEVQQSTNAKYRIACYFIAFACFGLAIGNIAHILRNGLEYAPIEVCSMISLSISVFQALLVTAAMIMLYTNRNVVVKKFIIHAIPFLKKIKSLLISLNSLQRHIITYRQPYDSYILYSILFSLYCSQLSFLENGVDTSAVLFLLLQLPLRLFA